MNRLDEQEKELRDFYEWLYKFVAPHAVVSLKSFVECPADELLVHFYDVVFYIFSDTHGLFKVSYEGRSDLDNIRESITMIAELYG